jgi:hypothetical protein
MEYYNYSLSKTNQDKFNETLRKSRIAKVEREQESVAELKRLAKKKFIDELTTTELDLLFEKPEYMTSKIISYLLEISCKLTQRQKHILMFTILARKPRC